MELEHINVSVNATHDSLTEAAFVPLSNGVPNWCTYLVLTYMGVVGVVGTIGNTLVIVVELREKKKSVTDCFVLYLAIFDVLSLTITVPLFVIQLLGLWNSVSSSFGCKFLYWAVNALNMSSAAVISLIGIERLSMTSGTMDIFTPFRACVLSNVVFGVSSLLASPAFVYAKRDRTGYCIFDQSFRAFTSVSYGITFTVAIVSTIITAYTYTKIGKYLKGKIYPVNGQDERRHISFCRNLRQVQRVTLTMALVTIVFFVSTTLPSAAGLILVCLQVNEVSAGRTLIFLLVRLYMINNCSNPLLYIYLNSKFRESLRRLIRRY